MTTPAISADSHMDLVYMPHDAFTGRVSQKWKDRVPHVVDSDEGKIWVGDQDQRKLARVGYYGPGLTAGKRGAILVEEGFASGEKRSPADPELRRLDQERDGVVAEVMYGILGLSKGLSGGSGLSDPELVAVVYHAYNDFIAEFNATDPKRFCGLGCIPNHDVKTAVEEAKYCVERGLKGAAFVAWTPEYPVCMSIGNPCGARRRKWGW